MDARNTLPDKVASASSADKVVKDGKIKRWPVGNGIYLRVRGKGLASWEFRFSIAGQRYTETLGQYGRRPQGIPFGDIKDKTAEVRYQLKEGLKVPGVVTRSIDGEVRTVNDLADRWFEKKKKSVGKLEIVVNRYNNWIKPHIGNRPFDKVQTEEIERLLDNIMSHGYRTVANKALSDCKHIFNVAVKRKRIAYNPAQLLDRTDAGGEESSRKRKLSIEEIQTVFKVLRHHQIQFTRDNYLATAILLITGVRKNELLKATWNEFDFKQKIWRIPTRRVKKKNTGGYCVPIVPAVEQWLDELRVKSSGSAFVFPARRKSKSGHVCENTLNAALQKMFGKGKSNGKHTYPNLFEEHCIEHFVIHDLRRTSRTLMRSKAFLGNKRASFEAAERHLNHRLPALAETYDPDDFFDERKDAMVFMREKLASFINSPLT